MAQQTPATIPLSQRSRWRGHSPSPSATRPHICTLSTTSELSEKTGAAPAWTPARPRCAMGGRLCAGQRQVDEVGWTWRQRVQRAVAALARAARDELAAVERERAAGRPGGRHGGQHVEAQPLLAEGAEVLREKIGERAPLRAVPRQAIEVRARRRQRQVVDAALEEVADDARRQVGDHGRRDAPRKVDEMVGHRLGRVAHDAEHGLLSGARHLRAGAELARPAHLDVRLGVVADGGVVDDGDARIVLDGHAAPARRGVEAVGLVGAARAHLRLDEAHGGAHAVEGVAAGEQRVDDRLPRVALGHGREAGRESADEVRREAALGRRLHKVVELALGAARRLPQRDAQRQHPAAASSTPRPRLASISPRW